jgi:hypothetical protein
MRFIFAALISFQANAGFKKWLCERLIMNDPYQYEGSRETWIRKELERLQIRERWGRATEEELSHIEILTNELARRDLYNQRSTPDE